MRVLVDTNILLRLVAKDDPQHELVSDFIDSRLAIDELILAPQCLFELWTVLTRPVDVNGLGLTVVQASESIEALSKVIALYPDPDDLVEVWLHICRRYDVKGKSAHDARLVAFASSHQLEAIVTLNPQDFARYKDLQVICPLL